ncbi:hypothetical protein T439DRAFT_292168 [Meredithblackwellia eburnea MCA 4105]
MRRIFGGANLPLSSTSTSLASDALPSPGFAPSGPISPAILDENKNAAAASKGWFGAMTGTLGAGVVASTRLVRSNTLTGLGGSTGSTEAAPPLPAGASGAREEEDEYDSNKLPFGASRIHSPPPSATAEFRSPRRGHARTGSRASVDGYGGRVSVLSGRGTDGDRPGTPSEEKDSLMMDLLSGQAVIEAKDFAILDWDEMQAIKKEHSLLATRIASLTRSVALETKLRDSAAKLVRLSAPASATDNSMSSSINSSRPRVTREQAEEQLATANNKLAALTMELHRVGWKESTGRTKLLQHTAAVLALNLRRKDEEEQGLIPTPIHPHPAANGTLGSSTATRSSTLPNHTSERQTSPSPTSGQSGANANRDFRFEGASFFAGNKEAVVPGTRTPPWTSPSLSSSQFAAHNPAQEQMIKDLQTQLADLKELLASARSESGKVEDQLKSELSGAKRGEQTARDDLLNIRSELGDLRRELEQARSSARDADESLSSAQRELQEARRTAEDRNREFLSLQSGSSDSQREVMSARAEAADLAKKVAMLEVEKEEAGHRVRDAEDKTVELERTMEKVRNGHDVEIRRLRTAIQELEMQKASRGPDGEETESEKRLKGQISNLQAERRTITQSIGDVLRRHRTRAAVGPILRELPSFDDTAEPDDLATYLSSTVDAHFDKVSSHVTSLGQDLDNSRAEHEDVLSGVQDELKQAVSHRERWRNEAETHRRAKEQLEASHTELVKRADSQSQQLGGVQSLEQNLAAAQAESARLRTELSGLQTKVNSTEAQLAEANAQQTKSLKPLQDLWRSMPPLDTRQAASNSDDLSVLKTAFEQPRRPIGSFLSDVTSSSNKFTVESLTERIKVLLSEDLKLVNKLVAFESEKDTHKTSAEKAQKAFEEANASMLSYQKQEMEERVESSTNKEVSMLERLNDLTESLEATRAEKRKAETALASAQATARSAEEERAKMQQSLVAAQLEVTKLGNKPPAVVEDNAKLKRLEEDLQEAKDQLQDAMEELEDAKKREQKSRTGLLDQLSQVEQEVSSLKTQLRQAKRSQAKT